MRGSLKSFFCSGIDMKVSVTFHLLFIYLGLMLLVGCATSYNPVTDKQERILYSREKEIAIGKAVAKRIEKKYKLCEEKAQYVEWMGKKVAFASDRIALPYTFKVIDDSELNAFALPGGPVYVTRALLEKANEDELACVLGHEVAHICARHGVKKLHAYKLYTFLIIALLSKEETRDAGAFTAQAFNLIALGYSQEDELLADEKGMTYAHKAGFHPRGMITFLEKLKEEKRKKKLTSSWLSTHPPLLERITALEGHISNLSDSENKRERNTHHN
ncbi:M48 family metalloprotease, partial [bacterium]|nr:M48 family metalloprotease [bacterium]